MALAQSIYFCNYKEENANCKDHMSGRLPSQVIQEDMVGENFAGLVNHLITSDTTLLQIYQLMKHSYYLKWTRVAVSI